MKSRPVSSASSVRSSQAALDERICEYLFDSAQFSSFRPFTPADEPYPFYSDEAILNAAAVKRQSEAWIHRLEPLPSHRINAFNSWEFEQRDKQLVENLNKIFAHQNGSGAEGQSNQTSQNHNSTSASTS